MVDELSHVWAQFGPREKGDAGADRFDQHKAFAEEIEQKFKKKAEKDQYKEAKADAQKANSEITKQSKKQETETNKMGST